MTTNNKIKINLDSLKTRREWKRHKVTDGNNVYRILPPFGDSSNGYPYKKWQIIWGLFDPESGRARPFASSMINDKRCPVTEYVQQLKKRAEQIKAEMQASGENEEVIKDRLTGLNKLITDLSPKTVYIYNAADQSGEVGLLELKSTAHKKMKAEMAQYIHDYNQDPTSLNSDDGDSGVWFNIIRTGKGRDTEYDVKKVQQKVKKPTGSFTFEDDRSPLPDSVVDNYQNLAYDLSAVYQNKSYEDLQDILSANMAAIIEMYPDADLSANLTTETSQASSTKKIITKTEPKKVNLNLSDDGSDDDEEEAAAVVKSNRQYTKAKSSIDMDDDFMAEADALLRS